MKTASGRTVTGHALGADRLLIRPASGHQADTGLLDRTNPRKDTQAGSVKSRVTDEEHRHQPGSGPRRNHPHSHSQVWPMRKDGTWVKRSPPAAASEGLALDWSRRLTFL
jgi:hypothetical protein